MTSEKLTIKELHKLKSVFSCFEVKYILKNFTVEQIRKVINNSSIED
jgi:hypothetical protein